MAKRILFTRPGGGASAVRRLWVAALCIGTAAWLSAAPAWAQDEVIVYTRPDGGISVVNPAPACVTELQRPLGTLTVPGQCPALGLTRAGAIQWIRDKDVPATATSVEIRDRSTLPASRRFRDAWRRAGAGVEENLAEARKIRQGQLERDIDRKLRRSELIGGGTPAAEVAHQAYRGELRRLRRQLATDLGAVTDLDALEAWTPTYPADPQ